jgi:hypothetical protein
MRGEPPHKKTTRQGHPYRLIVVDVRYLGFDNRSYALPVTKPQRKIATIDPRMANANDGSKAPPTADADVMANVFVVIKVYKVPPINDPTIPNAIVENHPPP